VRSADQRFSIPDRFRGTPGRATAGLAACPNGLVGSAGALHGLGDLVRDRGSGGGAPLSFAGLLRQFRAEARLTQEELAEAAGLSPRSVSDLERGINRTARKDTAVLLADALSLTGQMRVLFVAAARGRAPAAEVLAARPDGTDGGSAAAATRSLPRDIGSFTGREPELARLLSTLAGAAGTAGAAGVAGVPADRGALGICVIDGMPGVGKTTPGAECTL
jgi:transcriptional regulator with XRE-family HTH domain